VNKLAVPRFFIRVQPLPSISLQFVSETPWIQVYLLLAY
jgi:hypothetical protein